MKILVAQLNPTIGDVKGNTEKIIHALKEGRKQKADIVLFPELTICGYPPEDLVFHRQFVIDVEEALEKIVPETKGLMAAIGLVRRNLSSGEKGLFNSAAILQDGALKGFQDKWLLPTYDVFDEGRYFEPGHDLKVWMWKGKKIGVTICEDIWRHSGYVSETDYSRDPIVELAKLKPDLMINLSASPYYFQKPEVRVKVCEKAALTLKCPVLLCAQVGGNDELVFDGYSIAVNEKGELRQLAKGFEEDLMLVDLDAPVCIRTFSYDPIRDLYYALVLGVRDYLHKQGFKRGLIGISGGVDSALVACIAQEALGKENVYGLALPSRYSSPSSMADAKKLAQNLGIRFGEISIEKPFKTYLDLLNPLFEGRPADTTEENIQARIRGMILMALSNKFGDIVLSTGNKSEMAMGYCTLYGDMAGGLAVISDVTKMQVYALAKWINRDREIIPQSIIDKAPSAELKPNQKDSDSLPDFAIVDAVLEGYVEDFLSAEEIAQKNNLDLNLVKDLIHRIHKAEYKRRQSPAGIRVTRKAFRAGRRYPIVEGWTK